MKIIVAPQAFKGVLSAFEAAEAIEVGLLEALPAAHIVKVPVADGGDGTLDVLMRLPGSVRHEACVTGPMGEPMVVEWGVMPDKKTAVLELARVCGLSVVPPSSRNPFVATTYGLGQLIAAVLNLGFRHFLIGVGGSATHDFGVGMLQALGGGFFDGEQRQVCWGARGLKKIETIDLTRLDPRIKEAQFRIACDVTNPVSGSEGAALVYAAQKGANGDEVEELELISKWMVRVIKRELGIDIEGLERGGAAGGVGAGLYAFLGASLETGAEVMLNHIEMQHKLKGASVVIVGEGCLDRQTVFDKCPIVVAKEAKKRKIAVLAVVGSLGPGYRVVHQHGIDATVATTFFCHAKPPSSEGAGLAVSSAAEQALRAFLLGTERWGT